jgi:signal transduction histidine kinase
MSFKEPGSKVSAQQKKISQATVRAQEQERNRISAELHDNVNQLVVTAKMHIGMARREGCCNSSALEQAEEVLLQVIEAIKALTHRLAPCLVEHKGLQESIEGIAAAMANLNIMVLCTVSTVLIEKLTSEQQLMVYRIVQEQTSNILKHAQATAVHIRLEAKEDEMAELLIADNGIGFNSEAQQHSGIGFINIYNRVTAFNGTLDITGTSGEGCTLAARFPLNPPADK